MGITLQQKLTTAILVPVQMASVKMKLMDTSVFVILGGLASIAMKVKSENIRLHQ